MLQALRYSIAQGFQEAQDNLGIMLLSPVNVAVGIGSEGGSANESAQPISGIAPRDTHLSCPRGEGCVTSPQRAGG
jgi:hypothetical protein